MNLGELLRDTARRLRAARLNYGHGTPNARDEAAFLVVRGLGLPFDAASCMPVSAAGRRRVARLLGRRIRERLPVAYLLREAWLDGEAFYVDRRVIIPRSHIAELLRDRLQPWVTRPARRALDLCAGSGCLAVLAAKAFPGARVDAADLSRAALAVARRNVGQHALRGRIRLVRSDLFDGLRGRRYDLIVSNPPYVTSSSMRALPPEYRFEPRMALAGGSDGLALVRRILEQAARHLEPGGLLVCEVGAGRKALERAYPQMSFTWPETSAQSQEVFLLPREDLPQRQKLG
ncbi:MAG TPA: 50S ribosomal protein L3 N(5)-glutamine methyltransferase [Burkholderiales bacterium]|nr:50S ribosomal protein L3 N(5)-glutamine methyltransferase [Burkholderiales bacterium]